MPNLKKRNPAKPLHLPNQRRRKTKITVIPEFWDDYLGRLHIKTMLHLVNRMPEGWWLTWLFKGSGCSCSGAAQKRGTFRDLFRKKQLTDNSISTSEFKLLHLQTISSSRTLRQEDNESQIRPFFFSDQYVLQACKVPYLKHFCVVIALKQAAMPWNRSTRRDKNHSPFQEESKKRSSWSEMKTFSVRFRAQPALTLGRTIPSTIQ